MDYSKSNGENYVPTYATWNFFDHGVDNLYDQTKKNSLLDAERRLSVAQRKIDQIEADSPNSADLAKASQTLLLAIPDWVGEEVTGEDRYYNASLVSHPYRDWERA